MPIIGGYEPTGRREAVVVCALRDAFTDDRGTGGRLCSREPDTTGRQLTDRFVSVLEIATLVRRHALTFRQHMVLWARFGRDYTQEKTAHHLHLSVRTVQIEEHKGVEALIRKLWDEPEYEYQTATRRTGDWSRERE